MKYELDSDETWKRSVGKYVISFDGAHLYCSCPSWKFQHVPPQQRVCKHIREYYPSYTPSKENPVRHTTKPSIPLFSELKDPERLKSLADFLWSEKYDGVRIVWNGKDLVTRTGRIVQAPQEFIDGLPQIELDGELWLGHHKFDQVRSAIQVGPKYPGWVKMKYMVFDTPEWPTLEFRERYERLKEIEQKTHSCTLVRQYPIKSSSDLTKQLVSMTARGSEGIVLRHPKALYKKGRNAKWSLKYKLVSKGRGKVVEIRASSCTVRVLEPKSAKDKEISLPIPYHDKVRIGGHVTFSYRGLTSTGKPRFARLDL